MTVLVGVPCTVHLGPSPWRLAYTSQYIDDLFLWLAAVEADGVEADENTVWFRVRAKAKDAA